MDVESLPENGDLKDDEGDMAGLGRRVWQIHVFQRTMSCKGIGGLFSLMVC